MNSAPEQDHTGGTGWPAQGLSLPVSWYEAIERGSGCGFPISGDDTRCWP